MASIRDAVEESVIEGGLAYTKYILLGALVYYCVSLYNKSASDNSLFWIVGPITLIICLGFSLITTSNVKNSNNDVLPSFNIFKIIGVGIKGLVSIGPIMLVNAFFAKMTSQFINGFMSNYVEITRGTAVTIEICTCAVFGSFILTAYLLYSNKFKITDAYNIKLIYKYCIDILLGIFFFIPKIALVDGIVVGGVTYIFWLLFGIPHPVCTFFWSLAFAWNLAVAANYLAQVNYEVIDYNEKNNEKSILDID